MSNMNVQDYLKLQGGFSDQKVFDAAREQFFKEHPDCPKPEPIECLNLIMRREFAEAIIRGEKTVEVRAYSDFYCKMLYDKRVLDYEEEHWDDELMRLQMIDFNDSVRAVKKIHFHNYNNSWFLDVECDENNTVVVVDDQIKYLEDEFGCHEFDEMLAALNKYEELYNSCKKKEDLLAAAYQTKNEDIIEWAKEVRKPSERPIFFYFTIGRVLATNLK